MERKQTPGLWTSPWGGPEGQISLAVLWMGLQGLCFPCGDSSEQRLPCHSFVSPQPSDVRGY